MLPILRRVYFKKICFLVCLCACIITAWCENSINSNSLSISVSDYIFEYNGNTKLEQISLKSDEDKEIIALYQKAWENVWYRDSLLIAEKYAQWLWVNTFAQLNIDTLNDYNLTIENIKKTQINIRNKNQKRSAVVLEYDIMSWFIENIPPLYMSQIFVEDGSNIILLSYSTENIQARNDASNMFKNIK